MVTSFSPMMFPFALHVLCIFVTIVSVGFAELTPSNGTNSTVPVSIDGSLLGNASTYQKSNPVGRPNTEPRGQTVAIKPGRVSPTQIAAERGSPTQISIKPAPTAQVVAKPAQPTQVVAKPAPPTQVAASSASPTPETAIPALSRQNTANSASKSKSQTSPRPIGPEPPAQVFFDYSNVKDGDDDDVDDEEEEESEHAEHDEDGVSQHSNSHHVSLSQIPVTVPIPKKSPVSGRRTEVVSNVETAPSRGEHVDNERQKGLLQEDPRFDGPCDPYDDRDTPCLYGNGDRTISSACILLTLVSLAILYLYH